MDVLQARLTLIEAKIETVKARFSSAYKNKQKALAHATERADHWKAQAEALRLGQEEATKRHNLQLEKLVAERDKLQGQTKSALGAA